MYVCIMYCMVDSILLWLPPPKRKVKKKNDRCAEKTQTHTNRIWEKSSKRVLILIKEPWVSESAPSPCLVCAQLSNQSASFLRLHVLMWRLVGKTLFNLNILKVCKSNWLIPPRLFLITASVSCIRSLLHCCTFTFQDKPDLCFIPMLLSVDSGRKKIHMYAQGEQADFRQKKPEPLYILTLHLIVYWYINVPFTMKWIKHCLFKIHISKAVQLWMRNDPLKPFSQARLRYKLTLVTCQFFNFEIQIWTLQQKHKLLKKKGQVSSCIHYSFFQLKSDQHLRIRLKRWKSYL